jgi:hypothetical protein
MLFKEAVAFYCDNQQVKVKVNNMEHKYYIKIQFVLHRKHITSSPQSPTG